MEQFNQKRDEEVKPEEASTPLENSTEIDQEFLSDIESCTMDYIVEKGYKFGVRTDVDLNNTPKLFLQPLDEDEEIQITLGTRAETDLHNLKQQIDAKIKTWQTEISKHREDTGEEPHATKS